MRKFLKFALSFALCLCLSLCSFACGGKRIDPTPTPSVAPSTENAVSSVYSVQNAEIILEMGKDALAAKTGATISGRIESSLSGEAPVYQYELALDFNGSRARFTLQDGETELFSAYGDENGFIVKNGDSVRPLSDLLSEYGLDVLNPFLEQFSASDLSSITDLWDDNFGESVVGKRSDTGYDLSATNDYSQKVNSYLTQFRPLFSLTGKELLITLAPDLIEGDPDEWFSAKKTALLEDPVKDLLSSVTQNPTYAQIASHVALDLFGLTYDDFLTQYGETTLPTLLAEVLKGVEGASPILTNPTLLKLALNTLLQQVWDNPVQQSLESAAEAVDPAYAPLVDLWLNRSVFSFAGLSVEIGCNQDGTPDYGLFAIGIAGIHSVESGEQQSFRNTVLLSMHFSYEVAPIEIPEITPEPSVEVTVEPSAEPSVEVTVEPSIEPSVTNSAEPAAPQA